MKFGPEVLNICLKQQIMNYSNDILWQISRFLNSCYTFSVNIKSQVLLTLLGTPFLLPPT